MGFASFLRRLWDRHGPARRLRTTEGDRLPSSLPGRDLLLLRSEGLDWSVGLRCPCGCGEAIELMLLEGVRPRWSLRVDEARRPTLHPSVHRAGGCRSHFWIERGRVRWCS